MTFCYHRYTTYLALLFLLSCSPAKENFLLGSWEAIEVTEEGQPLGVNVQEIGFTFLDEGRYTYRSTLNYKEAGSYYVESQYLFTTDTVNQATSEKAVEILQLNQDSLFLKMNDNGKERLLKLVRATSNSTH